MEIGYPNLLHEIEKRGINADTVCASLAVFCGETTDVAERYLGCTLPLTTRAAFYLRDAYFPECSVDYLFGR